MIDIFERLAPSYGRVVRKLALDTWYDRANVNDFLHKADYFRRRYERELVLYFREQGYRFNLQRIKTLSNRWFADQVTTSRKLVTLTDLKKGKLTEKLEDLDQETRADVLRLLQGGRVEGRVAPVVSFAENLEARAIQIGEDSAFEFGRDLNHAAVSDTSDTYDWTSQEDRDVRPTHRILNRKTFSYLNPPTTVDKYGHRHTGNPGTDWGCRCFEKPSNRKPLMNFIAKE